MSKVIEIIDTGRGPQLSTSRVTVQDLVPYLQQGWIFSRIVEAVPSLTQDEFEVVRRYYLENFEVLTEQDRCIRDRAARRQTTPEIEEILRRGGEKMAALREQFKVMARPERNGDHPRR